MSQVVREYRVRFAWRGLSEIATDADAEVIMDLGVLEEPPVVTGSMITRLSGGVIQVRPFLVEGIDIDEDLVRAFTDEGRWALLGRVVDIQYRDVLPESENDE